MPDKLINSSKLRKALGTFATGVTVVTTTSEQGEMAGITVNSFTSVSLSPPLILWCLASTSESLNLFKSAEYFAVNILASDQRSLSNHFATRQENKFNSVKYQQGHGNIPLIDGCITWLQCKTTQSYEAGDHWIIIGEVIDLMTTSREGLIFNQSDYAIPLSLPSDETSAATLIKKEKPDIDSYFSLLFQAIHSYQEKLGTHQKEIIESDYEARVLTVFNKLGKTSIDGICNVIKIPKSDMQLIIQELKVKGFIDEEPRGGEIQLCLTKEGKVLSDKLIRMIQQHDEKLNELLGENTYKQFRNNLKKIIDWQY